MARVKINIPDKNPLFETEIPVRITDINYGNHLGNDRILAIIHEVRVQWLQSLGYTELAIGGCGLIMADAAIVYKNEGKYGDCLTVKLYCDNISNISFDLYFEATNQDKLEIAFAKTGMVGFDYHHKKPAPLPSTFKNNLL